ncbi:MAG: D-alanyl-D-alanine carboxypeptidase family protein [Firmicutes bacterium]|nr:D-alanyl-D-alanine carboxypeptidase family protein [Bacillota bacterium]
MAKKRRRRLKKNVKIVGIALIIVIIVSIISVNKYKEYLYHQTYEYKLLQVGYNMDETKLLLSKLNDDYINSLLEESKNDTLVNLLKEKYYINDNLDRYLEYIKKNKNTELNKVVAVVNTNRDYKYYEHTKATDMSKGNLILVNKYNYLDKEFKPELVNVSSQYAFEGNGCTQEVLSAFENMADAARSEDIVLVINSSYRSYDDQEAIWSSRKKANGTAKADAYAARAGFSEHQSGLAIDIAQYRINYEDFEETPGFAWLSEHAQDYGFILRYPKDKEDITGYSYESWHYRYVGVDAAKKIKEEGISFDEYYAFYIENK